MANYEQEFIELADELLNEFGTTGVYKIKNATADTDKPWLEVSSADINHDIKIAVFPTNWRNETSRGYMENSEVPAGKIEAIMVANGFEPLLPAVVIVNNTDTYRVISVDKLAPAGIAIIYTLELDS